MQQIQQLLAQYQLDFPAEHTLVERFHTLLIAREAAFERHHFTPGHLTSSCWLLHPHRHSVLLTYHKKLNRWLQLGGHVDGDHDLLRSSLREATEESGIAGITALSTAIIDLDIHNIPDRHGEPAHQHFDCRFLLLAPSADYIVSEESHDLRWIKLAEIDQFTEEESLLRLARKSQRQLVTLGERV